jgi:hypothetical protein
MRRWFKGMAIGMFPLGKNNMVAMRQTAQSPSEAIRLHDQLMPRLAAL